MNKSLEGKVVLITGGTRGIGKHIAEALAHEGAIVWTTSRNSPIPNQLQKIENGNIQNAFLDLEDEGSICNLFKRIDDLYGRLDILINNAGIGVFKPLTEITLKEWQEVMNVNLTGLFLCSREAFKMMKLQGGGRIINIGSVAGYIPIAENGAYGTSKFAIRGFSQIMNEEGKHDHVHVTVINAGIVYSDLASTREGFNPEDMLHPMEIAKTVLDIATRPHHVRIDEVNILPPKGIL